MTKRLAQAVPDKIICMKSIDVFHEGLLVRQKCGGPVMWVVSIDEAYPCGDETHGGLFCAWEEGTTLYEHVFSPYALDIIRADMRRRPPSEERRSPARDSAVPPWLSVRPA